MFPPKERCQTLENNRESKLPFREVFALFSFLLSLSLHLLNQMIDEMKGICQKAKLIERIVHLWNAEMEKGTESPAELCNEYKFYF